MEPARPNPFNPAATLRYEVPEAGVVRVTVIDALGRRVRTLADGIREAGAHEVMWEGREEVGRPASGAYWVRVETVAGACAGTVLLLR